MREIRQGKMLLWFRTYEPEDRTIEEIIKEFDGVLYEFYNLTIHVSKVEKGMLVKITCVDDLYKLANILKNIIIISKNVYTVEDKNFPDIYQAHILYI